jgi:hypothetical protein
MTTKKKANARLTSELLEMAKGMHANGIMTDAAYKKIAMRVSEGVGTTTVAHSSKNRARSAVTTRGAKI